MRISIFFVLILFHLLAECQTVESNKSSLKEYISLSAEEINNLMPKREDEIKISTFKADLCLDKLLDRIIELQKNCSSFIEGESCFIVYTKKDSCFYRISFISSSLKEVNYNHCVGILEFKNSKFILNGILINELFYKSNSNILTVKCSMNGSKSIEKGIDDSFSEWVYKYKDKNFKLIFERLCEGYKKK